MALRLPRFRVNRLWLVLGGAILMGLLAAWLTVKYLNSREKTIEAELAERAKGGPTLTVVVPTGDVPKGTIISGGNMATRDVLTDLLYDDVVTADTFADFDGKRLLRPVLKGRPLRRSDLVDEHAQDLASGLESGRRALTFDIDEVNSFAQMLRPGNFVDLYLIAQSQGPNASGQEVRALLPRVKVIATGQTLKNSLNVEPEPGQPLRVASYNNITVEVSPAEAARITLAQEAGKIRALLRNTDDEADADFDRLATPELFSSFGKSGGGAVPLSVEYIVGGSGGGTGASAPINITLPPGLASAGATVASGAAAASANPLSSALSPLPPSVTSGIPGLLNGTAPR
jgi:pilus assembly protein CpaB